MEKYKNMPQKKIEKAMKNLEKKHKKEFADVENKLHQKFKNANWNDELFLEELADLRKEYLKKRYNIDWLTPMDIVFLAKK